MGSFETAMIECAPFRFQLSGGGALTEADFGTAVAEGRSLRYSWKSPKMTQAKVCSMPPAFLNSLLQLAMLSRHLRIAFTGEFDIWFSEQWNDRIQLDVPQRSANDC